MDQETLASEYMDYLKAFHDGKTNERFGQYISNKYGVEVGNSYYETNTKVCYDMLDKHIGGG